MGEGDLIEDKVRLTGASEEVLGGIFTIQHPLVVAGAASRFPTRVELCITSWRHQL